MIQLMTSSLKGRAVRGVGRSLSEGQVPLTPRPRLGPQYSPQELLQAARG